MNVKDKSGEIVGTVQIDYSDLHVGHIGSDLIVNGQLCKWLDINAHGNWIIEKEGGEYIEIQKDDILETSDSVWAIEAIIPAN